MVRAVGAKTCATLTTNAPRNSLKVMYGKGYA